jgi:hypothetical protein
MYFCPILEQEDLLLLCHSKSCGRSFLRRDLKVVYGAKMVSFKQIYSRRGSVGLFMGTIRVGISITIPLPVNTVPVEGMGTCP